MVVARQHGDEAALGERRGTGPAQMAAAAHHIGRAHHHRLARRAGVFGHGLRHGEFADGGTERAEQRTVRQRRVIMAQHGDVRRARRIRQTDAQVRHLGASLGRALRERDKLRLSDAGATGIFPEILRVAQLLHDAGRMVVEAQQMHLAGCDGVQRRGFGGEIIGLEAQMHAQLGAGRRCAQGLQHGLKGRQ